MWFRRKLKATCLALALLVGAGGCAQMAGLAVDALTPGDGIQVDAQVGDRENTATLMGDIENQAYSTDEVKGDQSIESADTKVEGTLTNYYGLQPTQLTLVILGALTLLLFPSPLHGVFLMMKRYGGKGD